MAKIKGKEVDIFNDDTLVETTNIGDMGFKVFKFYRVIRGETLRIMYARVGDIFYGGIRYTDEMDEMEIISEIANKVLDGILESTNEIEHHARLGRKIELLDKRILLGDFIFKTL